MEKAKTITEVKHFIECPHCAKSKTRVDHLFSEKKGEIFFGPWYCDECGLSCRGKVIGSDVYVEKCDKSKQNSIVFLRNGNVLLAVKGMYFDGDRDDGFYKYYYGEHGTCPTNYLGEVEMVIDLNNGNTDPHGIFEFVGSIPYVDLDKVDDIRGLLPDGVAAWRDDIF